MRGDKMVQKGHLSLSELRGMLRQLEKWKGTIVRESLNQDVGIVEDDIVSMKARIADKINEVVIINELQSSIRISKKVS